MNRHILLTLALTLSALFAFDTIAQEERSSDKRPKPPKFESFDGNQDGLISLQEFKQKRPPHKTAEEIFESIDTDGNGQINEAEFKAHKPPKRHKKRSGKSERG